MDLQMGTATYEGETDEHGRRHGRGKLQYADGSWYDGDWDCGLRHGVGEFHQQSGGGGVTVYKGQWYNDLKHGIGIETYPQPFHMEYN